MASALPPHSSSESFFENDIFEARMKKYKKVFPSSPRSTSSRETYILETDSEDEAVFPKNRGKTEQEIEDSISNTMGAIRLKNRMKDFDDLNHDIEAILRELGDSEGEDLEEGAEGLWDISEPELLSSSDSEAEVNVKGQVPQKLKKGTSTVTPLKNINGNGCRNDKPIAANNLNGNYRNGAGTSKPTDKVKIKIAHPSHDLLPLDFNARGRGDNPSRGSSSSSSGNGMKPSHVGPFSSIRDRDQHQRGSVNRRQENVTKNTEEEVKVTPNSTPHKRSTGHGENGSRKNSFPTKVKSALGGFTFAKKKTGGGGEGERRPWS